MTTVASSGISVERENLESSVRDALTRGILGATHKKHGGRKRSAFLTTFFAAFSERRERDGECTKMAEWPKGDRRPKTEDFHQLSCYEAKSGFALLTGTTLNSFSSSSCLATNPPRVEILPQSVSYAKHLKD